MRRAPESAPDIPTTWESSRGAAVRQPARERADGSLIHVAAGVPEIASREDRPCEEPVMPRWKPARFATDPKFRLDG
ncbi:hypothetical protein SAMN04487905_109224 [Actinopolyspora xinjiangensis]|uniref:Uncharacterized protein n=1 Tax=Actinopolyspora xinjiangensis TaxID=405564 RepID=A0A1H0VUK8_9ACTN|nr:hypothetical protein [Actinopolyspora xinjiangensis]SDP81776.1 hypothetical protein SAMN04487905_109224 [Actinopolyspora xinjiangensis]